jgi:hypothetical protein
MLNGEKVEAVGCRFEKEAEDLRLEILFYRKVAAYHNRKVEMIMASIDRLEKELARLEYECIESKGGRD